MLLLLATLAFRFAYYAAQVPLVRSIQLASDSRLSWTDAPSPDSTAGDIFNSLNSLLQFWPNTIFRTGHTLVPSTIPAGTILHHGTFYPDATVPTSFDWLAFDFEHAYIFCTFDCQVLKFVANRDLRVLYLDGASAAEWIGTMHMQDILLYGEVPDPDRDSEEWPRAGKLCEWGVPLGLDGFVRMEFHFEIIYCDFFNGLTLLEALPGIPKTPENPWHGSNQSSPPGWVGTQLDAHAVWFQAMIAGEWHARAPGETRVRPRTDKAVTFYDPALSSLRSRRRGVPRTQYSLAGISTGDAKLKVEEIEEVLRAWSKGDLKGSEVDWTSAIKQIEERYSARLLELNDTLHSTSYANVSVQAMTVRRDVFIMISPYLDTADVASASSNSTSWLNEPMIRCGTFATAGIRAVFSELLTSQEQLILDAIEGTQNTICRVIGLIWMDAFGVESADEDTAGWLLPQWMRLVDELLAWLDWASFRGCRPACAPDEICYVTTWPFILDDEDPSDLEFTPRCISIHSKRRKDDPPGWPPTPPRNVTVVERLGEPLVVRAASAQIPLVSPDKLANSRWRWTDAPSPDSTAADVFNSLNSLLQFWPNTIFRTGHTLVPSIIPAGTILHHGTFYPNATVPSSFDWLAFDFEHAYIFCTFDCEVFKFVANRDLKVLYMDGASAANCIGAMQTQDVLLYGEVPDSNRDWEEWPRAGKLCEWGVPLGLDGFVRMEFHFEVMYCNFSNGLTLLEPLSAIPHIPPPPGILQSPWHVSNYSGFLEGWEGTLLNSETVWLQAMIAGEWHALAPGETRVRPHIPQAVTFHDPALSSLHEKRRGVSRTQHQLAGISREDAQTKIEEIEGVIKAWNDEGLKGSGADWASAMRQVEERYGARLLELNDTLHSTSYVNASAQVTAVRRDVLIMISPYLATADVARSSSNPITWLNDPMARCGTFMTAGIRTVFSGSFTAQELLILDAIEGTQSAICRVIGLIWLGAFGVESVDEDIAGSLIPPWTRLVDELLTWLDWASFRACKRGCARDEFCYVTTWPYTLDGDDPTDFDFTPRCISTHSSRRKDDPPGWPPIWWSKWCFYYYYK